MNGSAIFSVTKEMAEAIAACQNALSDDGKIGWGEGIDIAIEGGGLIIAVAKNLPELKASMKDGISSEELEAAKEAFREGYVLNQPVTEELIEAAFLDVITAIISIVNVFTRSDE